MRIISGKYKSQQIIAPKNLPTRPTTDMAKSGIFNIIHNNWDYESIQVLDLFSGTGNISFEFASRGCEQITSVDQNANCIKFIKAFSQKLNIKGLTIVRDDVFKFIQRYNEKPTIIFADPPYALPNLSQIPDLIFKYQILAPKGWLIVETDNRSNFEKHEYYSTHRTYGNCIFWIFTWTAKDA